MKILAEQGDPQYYIRSTIIALQELLAAPKDVFETMYDSKLLMAMRVLLLAKATLDEQNKNTRERGTRSENPMRHNKDAKV